MTTGICQCGCGLQTWVATKTSARLGWVKGVPVKFVHGHGTKLGERRRLTEHGYVLVWAPDHPRAKKNLFYEHILVAERAVGRPLPASVRVHHRNENTSDNRNGNLVVLENQSEHADLHYRMKVLRAGGNPWTQRVCGTCWQLKDASEFYVRKGRKFETDCKACSCVSWRARGRRPASCRVGSI